MCNVTQRLWTESPQVVLQRLKVVSEQDIYYPYTCHPGMLLSRTKSAWSRFEQPMAGPQDEIHGCIS